MSFSDADGGDYAYLRRAGERSPTSHSFESGSFEAEVFVLDWAVAAEEPLSAPAPDEWGGLRNEGFAVSLDG